MIIIEFYKYKLKKVNSSIKDTENNKDYKKLAKLKYKKAEFEKRIKEIESRN